MTRVPKYKVDYGESRIKGEFFLNYLGNLRMCVAITNVPTLADKTELLKTYITSRLPQGTIDLSEEVGKLLMQKKGIYYNDGFLTVTEREKFLEENADVLGEWEKFLDSVPFMVPFVFNYYRDTIGKELLESGDVEVIDNPLLVSPNVINLFYMPDYIESYLSKVQKALPRMYSYLFYSQCFEKMGLIDVLQSQTTLVPFLHMLGTKHMKENEPLWP